MRGKARLQAAIGALFGLACALAAWPAAVLLFGGDRRPALAAALAGIGLGAILVIIGILMALGGRRGAILVRN